MRELGWVVEEAQDEDGDVDVDVDEGWGVGVGAGRDAAAALDVDEVLAEEDVVLGEELGGAVDAVLGVVRDRVLDVVLVYLSDEDSH